MGYYDWTGSGAYDTAISQNKKKFLDKLNTIFMGGNPAGQGGNAYALTQDLQKYFLNPFRTQNQTYNTADYKKWLSGLTDEARGYFDMGSLPQIPDYLGTDVTENSGNARWWDTGQGNQAEIAAAIEALYGQAEKGKKASDWVKEKLSNMTAAEFEKYITKAAEPVTPVAPTETSLPDEYVPNVPAWMAPDIKTIDQYKRARALDNLSLSDYMSQEYPDLFTAGNQATWQATDAGTGAINQYLGQANQYGRLRSGSTDTGVSNILGNVAQGIGQIRNQQWASGAEAKRSERNTLDQQAYDTNQKNLDRQFAMDQLRADLTNKVHLGQMTINQANKELNERAREFDIQAENDKSAQSMAWLNGILGSTSTNYSDVTPTNNPSGQSGFLSFLAQALPSIIGMKREHQK